jgi:hypothetical protein
LIGEVQFPLGVEDEEDGVNGNGVAVRLEGSEGRELEVAG